MDEPIQGTGRSVGSILGEGTRIETPYFQRGYAWQREHVERLLSDVIAHASGTAGLDWYPLGAIILARVESNAAVLAVADGHQRLITLTLVIAILRDLETGDAALRARLAGCIFGEDGAPRLTTIEGARRVLNDHVQVPGAALVPVVELPADASPSEEAIVENRDWLIERLSALPPEERRAIARFLLDRTFLVVMMVANEQAARLLFATMHETGVRPQLADLLKSEVLGRLSGDVRDRARIVWEGIEGRLGRERMEPLLLHVVAIRSRTIPTDRVDAAVARAFDLSSPAETASFVLDHLRPLGACHIEMLNAGVSRDAQPVAVYRRLQYLGWLNRHETWRLPALHWLTQTSHEAPQTLEFLRRLEALAWMQTVRATEIMRRDRRYLDLLGEIDQGRALDPGGALTVSATERDEMRAILVGPNMARRPYKLFLLLRLNALREGDGAILVPPEATVEHVFPQRPGSGSRWQADFADADTAVRLRHTLGNLTLLTEAEQNEARNRDFELKREVYARSEFALSRRLGEAGAWDPDAITERTDRLVDDLFASFGIT